MTNVTLPFRTVIVLLISYIAFIGSISPTSAFSYRHDNRPADGSAERQLYFDLPSGQVLDGSSAPILNSDESYMASDKSIENVTIKVGQQAVLPCFVNNLGSFKVIWSKDGDILALGSSKINSDPRLNVQHRYVSEWHLIIDSVVTDDEGEYVCKTNGAFYKVINLQVLMPPAIDDVESTPAGTRALKEDSSVTLRCVAEGKPMPTIRWYRWKKYKHLISDKEELSVVGNEIVLPAVRRNDPNTYECIARNSVPPATSRIFNIDIHFLPSIELEIRKTFQFLHKQFSLECKISANPLERVYWLKNGAMLSDSNAASTTSSSGSHHGTSNFRVDKYDISNVNDYFKMLLTLTVMNADKQDFGEYQCCAVNAYGQVCSNIFVQEIKSADMQTATVKASHTGVFLSSLLPDAAATTRSYVNPGEEDEELANIIGDTLDEEDKVEDEAPLGSGEGNSLDAKDKRRHYLMKSKEFLHLAGSPEISTSTVLKVPLFMTLLVCCLATMTIRFSF